MMRFKKLVAMILCGSMLLTVGGCGDNGGSSEGDLITLSTITYSTVTTALTEGVTLTDNPWQDLWKDNGIQVEYSYVAADSASVQEKVNLAIISGEIPDFMQVGYSTYKEMLEADMIADLTDVFEEHASDQLKELMYADGGTFADYVTEDGRLYGIVQPAEYTDHGGVVAIRTDWLRELGLEEPNSMDDLWDIAKAFVDNKMGGTCTIGIGASKEMSTLLPMLYLINAHGGLVNIWVERDGELVNGITLPETKAALEALREKYASGLLDKEYGTKQEAQVYEDAVAGKSGIVIGNFTSPFMLDNGISLGQEWSYFPLYGEEGEYAKVEINASMAGCLVVSKECEHPEAVIELLNLYVEYSTDPGHEELANSHTLSYPAVITETGKNQRNYLLYTEYLETGIEPEEGVKTSDYDRTVETCEKWNLNGDVTGRPMYNVFGPNGTESVLEKELAGGGYLLSAYTAPACEAEVAYGGMLGGLTNQMIANIITGAEDMDYYDEFVARWKQIGGDEITEQVNEWYKNQ